MAKNNPCWVCGLHEDGVVLPLYVKKTDPNAIVSICAICEEYAELNGFKKVKEGAINENAMG